MATRRGIVKKTSLADYSRPKRGGIIAIKLDEGDMLIDVVKVTPGDDVVLSTRNGMSIRFTESDARAMGRNTMGVKGISLTEGDELVGMVVAAQDSSLLTACERGYGKRTPFGPGVLENEPEGESEAEEEPLAESDEAPEDVGPTAGAPQEGAPGDAEAPESPDAPRTNMRYRRQRRGGKGLRDIKTTERNGNVVGILAVHDADHVLMVSSSGKIQRIRASDIRPIGRNTQGVRIMSLDEGDTLASLARIPAEVISGD
jgi:DNA gyrase subunit A